MEVSGAPPRPGLGGEVRGVRGQVELEAALAMLQNELLDAVDAVKVRLAPLLRQQRARGAAVGAVCAHAVGLDPLPRALSTRRRRRRPRGAPGDQVDGHLIHCARVLVLLPDRRPVARADEVRIGRRLGARAALALLPLPRARDVVKVHHGVALGHVDALLEDRRRHEQTQALAEGAERLRELAVGVRA